MKKILEKDDTEKGVEAFNEVLGEKNGGGLDVKVEDLNLLLRWTVTEQKKYFPKFYETLVKYMVGDIEWGRASTS